MFHKYFAHLFQWIRAYSFPTRSETHNLLDRLFSKVGIPIRMRPDNAIEPILGDWKRKLQRYGCLLAPIEANTPNLNLAELSIREVKRLFRRFMRTLNAPAVLWDYCFELAALVRSHTCLGLDQLDGKPPETKLLGDTMDISFLSEFASYDYVWYHVLTAPEMQNRLLGLWLGPSTDCGEAMSLYILTQTAQFVSRIEVYPLSVEDRNSEVVTEKKRQFDACLAETLGGPRINAMNPMNTLLFVMLMINPYKSMNLTTLMTWALKLMLLINIFPPKCPATVRGQNVVRYCPLSKTRCK
jgi:hypothetical protein